MSPEMSASELATKMLEWEDAKEALDKLEKDIQHAVLSLGRPQSVGNIRATFCVKLVSVKTG